MTEKNAGNGAAQAITAPPVAVRAYLRAANIAAVCVLADQTVTAVRDVGRLHQPALEAWWTTPAAALQVMWHCRQHDTLDMLGVAAGLHIALTPHEHAVERAAQCIAKIDAVLAKAKANGAMKWLNAGYRHARHRALARGETFPAYRVVYDRFLRALYSRAVNGQQASDRTLIEHALGTAARDGAA